MYKFYLFRYKMGKITADELKTKVPKWITEDEYETITGLPYVEEEITTEEEE